MCVLGVGELLFKDLIARFGHRHAEVVEVTHFIEPGLLGWGGMKQREESWTPRRPARPRSPLSLVENTCCFVPASSLENLYFF